MSLNTFPYVAVPAYWVFGRSTFRGYVTARQTGDLEIQLIAQTASAESAELRSTAVRAGATRAAEQLAEMPTLRGNTLELLIDGDATFASIFDGIEHARDYVLVQFYIVKDDGLGRGPLGEWRDTHVKIEGPAALAVQLSFFEDWHWATDSIPNINWKPQHINEDGADVLIVPTGPANELETAGLMFIHAINSAQERIWIASPYFVPDEAVIAALQLASLRGVDVRIQIPDEPDHLLVYLAAYSYFDEAGSTGVKFYRYTEGFLHHKAMLVDHRVSAVGTANFDNRSFRLNFEITAFVADEVLVAEVEEMFLDDFAAS